METLYNIITNATSGPVEWIIFVCIAFVAVLGLMTAWSWVGEKILKHTNLGDKLNKILGDEQY